MWNLSYGVPFAVGIDEPQIVDRALRILRTGQWNTHLFDYPSLVIYFHALVAIGRFLWGAVNGEWGSLDAFTMTAAYGAGRFFSAALGVLTVWLTYRLGAAVAGRRAGLLAALQLAVNPIHLRESHFILTDVPMAALTTLAVLLAMRAGRLRTVRSYAWAGAACGLAAAAKYTGAIALTSVAAVWILHERRSRNRLQTALASIVGAAAGFLTGAPYSLLDLPEFLDGFAAQFSRFAGVGAGDPPWRSYLKHLATMGWWWVPLAIAGIVVLIASRRSRTRAIPPAVVAAAYFYTLATHAHVFARYAVPLTPLISVFAAAALVALVDAVSRRVRPLESQRARAALLLTAALAIAIVPVITDVQWLKATRRADTRSLAADWLRTSTPKGTRVAVENSGPTYLTDAGFKVAGVQQLTQQPIEFYLGRVDYLIISSADLSAYGPYLNAGSTVFQVEPGQRWGPPIRIVKIR